jgi:L-ascorbate metabolism protein UlaG (beta-lactamase superfamily)
MTQTSETRIRYLGWSAFEIETPSGSLIFDPAFTNLYGANWAKKKDYSKAKVICVTHGHSDH